MPLQHDGVLSPLRRERGWRGWLQGRGLVGTCTCRRTFRHLKPGLGPPTTSSSSPPSRIRTTFSDDTSRKKGFHNRELPVKDIHNFVPRAIYGELSLSEL